MEIKTNGILFGMNRKELNSTLSDLSSKAEKFTEPVAREVCHTSFGLVEYFFEKTEVQDKKIQKMQDEINLLKGEKGQPDVNKQSGNNGKNNNHSSENERKNRDPKKPRKPGGTKKASVTVDRIMNIPVDKSTLPEGMTRHGTTSTVVQDIHFGTDNIEFRRETYYNKDTKQWVVAPLPEGYDSEYGPKIKAYIKVAYSKWGMTIGAIVSALTCMEIKISDATVSRILLKGNEPFHQEKNDIVKAGTESTPYQHIDDTSGREKGKNRYVHILASPYYTAYFTTAKKSRLTILELLSPDGLEFLLNQNALYLMEDMGLPKKYLSQITETTPMGAITHGEMQVLQALLFPDADKQKKNRNIVLEACAIIAYQANPASIQYLIADDAPQFKLIVRWLGWVLLQNNV
ncbi:MAG: transposase [Gammaproteobacteria bacterium]|nr:transposase [Gammaproteobacteria bacterium]